MARPDATCELKASSYPKTKIKLLLLENISPTAVELFAAERFQVVRSHPSQGALPAQIFSLALHTCTAMALVNLYHFRGMVGGLLCALHITQLSTHALQWTACAPLHH